MKRANYSLNLRERPSKLGRISTRFDFKGGSLLCSSYGLTKSPSYRCVYYLNRYDQLNRTKNCHGYKSDFCQPFMCRVIPIQVYKPNGGNPCYDLMQRKFIK